jgi:hypothetical protein
MIIVITAPGGAKPTPTARSAAVHTGPEFIESPWMAIHGLFSYAS